MAHWVRFLLDFHPCTDSKKTNVLFSWTDHQMEIWKTLPLVIQYSYGKWQCVIGKPKMGYFQMSTVDQVSARQVWNLHFRSLESPLVRAKPRCVASNLWVLFPGFGGAPHHPSSICQEEVKTPTGETTPTSRQVVWCCGGVFLGRSACVISWGPTNSWHGLTWNHTEPGSLDWKPTAVPKMITFRQPWWSAPGFEFHHGFQLCGWRAKIWWFGHHKSPSHDNG